MATDPCSNLSAEVTGVLRQKRSGLSGAVGLGLTDANGGLGE